MRGHEGKTCVVLIFSEKTRLKKTYGSVLFADQSKEIFECIQKHGAHLAHVTEDEHLLAAILGVRGNNSSAI